MNVLVCGTNYGATYLRALAMDDGSLTLAGILSRGSERSRAYAGQMGIPHYTSVDELPDGKIDIACVAVAGQAGTELTLALLSRGINVLAEHPIGAHQMQSALELARARNLTFQVNAHFADLHAPQAFFNAMFVARQQGPALHYSLSVNLRTLYSGLDLLGRAHGSLQGAQIQSVSQTEQSQLFRQLSISLPDTSVSLLCQAFSSERDDGSANLINHRLSAVFGHGNLLLCESNGPVHWFPTPVSMPMDAWRSCLPVDMTMPNSMELMQQRDYANLVTLKELVAVVRGEQVPLQQQPDYLIALALLWQECLETLTGHEST